MASATIPPAHRVVLRAIVERLGAEEPPIVWVVTGSLGFALQGVPVTVHDIDVQADAEGAYRIEACFSGYLVRPVCHVSCERVESHLGALVIDGVTVEIMGEMRKRASNDEPWGEPAPLVRERRWADVDGLRVPVLSLAYERDAYRALGQMDKARLLDEWLAKPPT